MEEVLKGYNCTIFAYGQTGTGKTYTMEGAQGLHDTSQGRWHAREAGMIARSIHQVFDTLKKGGSEYFVKVSHMEIYNENIKDLLNPTNTNLRLFEEKKGVVNVHNLEELKVAEPNDIFKILEKSWEERKTAETDMNPNSSRSHCIFTIIIHIKETTTEGEDFIKIGKLNFVDLAGSENISKSGTEKHSSRKQEAGNINKSLLTLGRVITSLTENTGHIPYRDSKLTRLLQDSLGGKTKTCIIATISPSASNFEETLNTLDYAHRAKNIKNKPEVNQKMAQSEAIQHYIKEIERLQKTLDSHNKKNGIYLPPESFESMKEEIEKSKEEIVFLQERILEKERKLEEIEEELNFQSVELVQKEKDIQEKTIELETKNIELDNTTSELNEAKTYLEEKEFLLQEHMNTEERIREEAKQVIGTLNTTIQDIDGLFSKIERKNDLEHNNMELTYSFREQLVNQLSETENKLNSFITASSRNHENLKLKIDQFMDDKEKHMNHLSDVVCELDSGVHQRVQSIEGRILGNNQVISGILTNVYSSQSELNQKYESLRSQFAYEANESINDISKTIETHTSNVQEWSSTSEEHLLNSVAKVTHFAKNQRELFNSVESKVGSYVRGHNERLSNYKRTLENFLSHQKEELANFCANTLQNVSTFLETFMNEQIEKTTRSIREIQVQLDQSVEISDAFHMRFDTYSKDFTKEVNEFVSQHNEEHNDIIGTIQTFTEDNQNFGNQNFELLESLQNKINEFGISTGNYFSEFEEFTTRQCHEGTKILESSRKDLTERVEEIMKFSTDMKKSLLQELTSNADSIRAYSSELETGILKTSQNTNAYISRTINQTNKIKENVKTFDLRNYEPTGQTPVKKMFNLNMNLVV